MNVVVKFKDITVAELDELGNYAREVYVNGDHGSVIFVDASNKIVEYLRRRGIWFDTTV